MLVLGVYTPNPDYWESHPQNFVTVSNFSKHLEKVNMPYFWSCDGIRIFSNDLVMYVWLGDN